VLAEILALAQELQQGDLPEIKTPYVTAPKIDVQKSRGFKLGSSQKGEVLVS
jgi:hypothetical protein